MTAHAETAASSPYSAASAPVARAFRADHYRFIEVRRASPFVGAYLSGVDLSQPVSDAVFSEIEAALAAHGVIFFRDQDLTPKQHIALAARFGEIDVNRFFRHVEGYPQIAEVRKEAGQKTNIGGGWHTDHSYDQIPATASLLYARELPELGGDTIFASTVAAFEALSPGLQKTLEALDAFHSSRHVFGAAAKAKANNDLGERIGNAELATQDAIHPVAFRHPITGDRSLYVNPGFTLRINGWTEQESQGLLASLYEHIKKPEFAHRFAWEVGSLAIWDNRTTWHLAVNDYSGERRLLHRITVRGR